MGDLLEVRGLTKVFSLSKHEDLVAVNNVSFALGRGETLGLVGESGSGKTTVGRCVLRLIEPTSGEVLLDGTDIRKLETDDLRRMRSRMQLVFQDPLASLNPTYTVRQTVSEPLALHGVKRAERHERVADMLRHVGIGEHLFNYYPADLTAGEQQRIGIARALITRPEIVVLDEPTSTLDASARAEILALLERIQKETGTSFIFISHDMTSIARICHRIAVMYLGRIVEEAPTDELLAKQYHPYSKALMSAVLFADPRRVPSPYVIKGEIPTAINPKPECGLYSRCPMRQDRCREGVPPLMEVAPARTSACLRWQELEQTELAAVDA
ncbi:ABC transporter ATP-binding protein [Microbaculum marinum]|uniref:ABC transporter ATP-binding protein n=1 Tax=Microbaculum marinum TaxID=1764581 RepID=A0AAW9RNK9_9HYPH